MDIELNQLMQGKPTSIRNKHYFATQQYVAPFIDRLSKYTDDFRVHVQTPAQMTLTETGEQKLEDVTYNRVYIEAVMPDDLMYANHEKAIGMVMGLDVRRPVAKFYSGALNSACTNLCVFNPSHLECQGIEPETPLDFKPLDRILSIEDDTKEILEKLHSTTFENSIFEQEHHLGKWLRNAMEKVYNSGFQESKIGSDAVIQAYKALFVNDDSPYYQIGRTVNMFDVYNAFTQQITNATNKGKDLINVFERTLLLRQILEF